MKLSNVAPILSGTLFPVHRVRWALVVVGLLLAFCQGAPPAQDRVDFNFTDGEWETYQSRVEEGSRKDFSLSVRLEAHQDYVRATAHLRGASSFKCARRNYTLNLYGHRPRFASFDSVTDEFFLLSLCRDRGFVRQHTGLKLWSALRLFPLQMRYVELRLNDRSRGVYLLVEKLDRIRLSSDALRVLLRRDFRRGSTRVEVKHSALGEQRAQEHYARVTADVTGLSGEPLIARFREHMDLDQYLMWIASNTLLQNGDSVDELWLIGRKNPRGQRGTDTYYTFFAWDADDIFHPCHADGEHAFRVTHTDWSFARKRSGITSY